MRAAGRSRGVKARTPKALAPAGPRSGRLGGGGAGRCADSAAAGVEPPVGARANVEARACGSGRRRVGSGPVTAGVESPFGAVRADVDARGGRWRGGGERRPYERQRVRDRAAHAPTELGNTVSAGSRPEDPTYPKTRSGNAERALRSSLASGDVESHFHVEGDLSDLGLGPGHVLAPSVRNWPTEARTIHGRRGACKKKMHGPEIAAGPVAARAPRRVGGAAVGVRGAACRRSGRPRGPRRRVGGGAGRRQPRPDRASLTARDEMPRGIASGDASRRTASSGG